MKFIKITTAVIAILFYIILFISLIYRNFVFEGHLVVEYDFENESPFISLLKPRGRVDQTIYTDENNDYYQKILIDPVYFDVKLPRQFDTAKVSIQYKNPYEPILELGIAPGEDSPYFYLQPMENKLIDHLMYAKNWYKIRENKTILLQNEPKYTSIKDFKNNIPQDKKTGIYNYDLPVKYSIENYTPTQEGLEINKSLRGSHQFYTYVGPDENLDFKFNFQDSNRGFGKDQITLQVFYDQRELYSHNI
jgi:hypothetical protein